MDDHQRNWNILQRTRLLRKRTRELRARLSRDAFYCKALAGESNYNIAVNADMTVSCNCRDYDGSGQLGDLSTQTLEEILSSPRSMHLRRELAAGRLPLLTCASCPELTRIPGEDADRHVHEFQVPTLGLMVENTSTCCYRCVGCYRDLLTTSRRRSRMSLDEIRRVAGELERHAIQTLFFFNQGEPFAAPDILEQLQIIRDRNPDLRIILSTNGALLDTDEKRRAALLTDHIYFSIDGTDDKTLNRYQVGARFERVYGNLRELVRFRDQARSGMPRIEWKYVLFNWNDRRAQVERAIDLGKAAGIDCVSFWPTRAPIRGISWRYHLSPFFRRLGTKSWSGRNVELRRDPALSGDEEREE